jgi:hypothetical protein
MVSRSAVASLARTRPATMSLSNPWTRTSSASVAPCGPLASSLSSSIVRRGCGLRRRFRMVVIVKYRTQAMYFQLTGVPFGCCCLGMTGPRSNLGPGPLDGRSSKRAGGANVRRVESLTHESNAGHRRRVPSRGSWAIGQAATRGQELSGEADPRGGTLARPR